MPPNETTKTEESKGQPFAGFEVYKHSIADLKKIKMAWLIIIVTYFLFILMCILFSCPILSVKHSVCFIGVAIIACSLYLLSSVKRGNYHYTPATYPKEDDYALLKEIYVDIIKIKIKLALSVAVIGLSICYMPGLFSQCTSSPSPCPCDTAQKDDEKSKSATIHSVDTLLAPGTTYVNYPCDTAHLYNLLRSQIEIQQKNYQTDSCIADAIRNFKGLPGQGNQSTTINLQVDSTALKGLNKLIEENTKQPQASWWPLTGYKFFIVVFVFSLALFWGFALILHGENKIERSAKLSLATTIALTLTYKFSFDTKFEFNFKAPINIYFNHPNGKWQKIMELGPFYAGRDTLDSMDIKLTTLRHLLDSIHPEEISVIGGVDKRQLINKASLRYIDNLHLSQARSNRVRDSILQYSGKYADLYNVFANPNGANNYEDNEGNWKKDRRVVILIRGGQ